MTVSDFYFLARGSHYFVGSIESTFSQLIADLVASATALRTGARSDNTRLSTAYGGSDDSNSVSKGYNTRGRGDNKTTGVGFKGEEGWLDGIYWVPPQSQGKYYNSLVNANKCSL
jgi:hypothetical protein